MSFLVRRAAAYQAYYEHMPLRRTSIPAGPVMQLYRDFSYGSLASFFVLDTRQYRNDQPCGDRNNVPMCAGVAHPHTTLLGGRRSAGCSTDSIAPARGGTFCRNRS